MRRLRPRPIVPLPDKFWITSEEFRLAMARSHYLWRRTDLPTLRECFPPVILGPDPIADARWRLDNIAERYPYLTAHFPPNTTFFDRFRQRQREASAAYVESKKSHQVAA
jgi:hypothetical protein